MTNQNAAAFMAEGRRITLLIAHPDDEILFLWPFLSRAYRIIACVSDEQNAERRWCNKRKYALEEVCKRIGAQFHCLEANSGFYRMPTREGALKRFVEDIGESLSDAQAIATHNAWGEYGHLDHLLCHHAARTFQAERSIFCTDIQVETNWLPINAWTAGEALEPVYNLDRNQFEELKAVYDRYGCWTYDREPEDVCMVTVC